MTKRSLSLVILLLIFLNCKEHKVDLKNNKIDSTQNISEKVNSFFYQLEKSEIKPTFSASLDSVSQFNSDLKIKSLNKNNHFTIDINGNKIVIKKLQTINDVWDKKDSVTYANQISEVKYYKTLNLVLLLLDFDMCTGLGCGVNYQLIYDLKRKQIYPFGRFRTGTDMNLYKFKDAVYYLSKTFHGRNAELRDTIVFNLYRIESSSIPQYQNKIFARFTYENEDYEKETSFIQNWLK